jgi:hypothetical protein
MSISIETGWVKPPHQIGGLDHLGVQAPCIQVYSQLLPGITNVTDRARYYSFYPWLITRFEREGWRSEEEILLMLRRAECLLTMISLQHEHIVQDGTDDHRAAMVGSDALYKAIDRLHLGERVKISDYSSLDAGSDRYFANPAGGLGQYYFGALKNLSLLSGDTVGGVEVVKETGAVLAEAVDQYVMGDQFIQVLTDDIVDEAIINELSSFCPCKVKQSSEEVKMLTGLMREGWSALNTEVVASANELHASEFRSRTLAYMCILADSASAYNKSFNLDRFRGLIYTACDTSGNAVKAPDKLNNIIDYWKVYQRNELLSVAMQGLFFAILRSAELSGKQVKDTKSLSNWFWNESVGKEVLSDFSEKSDLSTNWLLNVSNNLPTINNWNDEYHEIQCMFRLSKFTTKQGASNSEVVQVVKDSIFIIAALLFRDENKVDYDNAHFPERYLEYYPVNLSSVRSDWEGVLSKMDINTAFSSFTKDRCLDAHLRVAMRKLRQQGQNTFRFEPREIGLIIKSIPGAANTTPRFKQATRILLDLGLLVKDGLLTKPSQSGYDFIEQVT